MNKRSLNIWLLLIATIGIVVGIPQVTAFSSSLDLFEGTYESANNSRIDNCMLCHVGPDPGTNESDRPLNPYGTAYNNSDENFTVIEGDDSDEDGFTNIEEITSLTFPGDANDFPPLIIDALPDPTVTVNSNISESVTFNVTVNQPMNVTWLVNGTLMQDSITDEDNVSTFTATGDINGTNTVTANVTKQGDGSDEIEWTWIVGEEEIPEVIGPNITSFDPVESTVSNNESESRSFSITVNQTVNVSWFINDTEVFNETGVTESTYANISAANGTWIVEAIAENENGTDSHAWNWIVGQAEVPPPPPPPPVEAGTISGRVLVDVNDNQEIDAEDTGLEGVEILLIGFVSENGATFARERTTTDQDGFYQFENLKPGTYFVFERRLSGFSAVSRRTTIVDLGEGDASANNNFLVRPFGIIGTPTSTLTVTVTEGGIKRSTILNDNANTRIEEMKKKLDDMKKR